MENRQQDQRYDRLYSEIKRQAAWMHERNRKRIRWGSIGLIVLPFFLAFVRWMTHSDKVVFLLVWVFCMFAISIYLIGVEYLDDRVQKALQRATDGKESFEDGLIPKPGLPGRVRARAVKQPILIARLHPEKNGAQPEENSGEDGDQQ